jgi:hypothetical protein
VGSVGLVVREGLNSPRVLLVLFVLWVLAPFAALAWAMVKSARWPAAVRTALYVVVYGGLVAPPAGAARAAIYVMVPALSWALIIAAGVVTALASRGR